MGEGIETVLSPLTAMPGTTGAAALSVGSLGSFAPPPGLARLVIALDNDAEGERAAERPARCCERAGVATLVVVPEGGDFNDDLVALGPCALRARLHTLLCVRDAAAGRA
ncbi:MAG: toprim domain-containing protein [Defluviicoccus sp.]|nr:toprim domain-containing protein [Defluviicoccus sp.]